MKLLIAGSRTLNAEKLRDLLEINSLINMFDLPWPKEFVHGGCPTGADKYCNIVTDEYWDTTPTTVFKANWKEEGKYAGPKRNQKMAEYSDVLILIWDGTSKGSSDMKNRMESLGKPVYEIIIPKIKTKDDL